MLPSHVCWLMYGPATTGVDPRPARAADAFDALFPEDALRYELRGDATAVRMGDREDCLAAVLANGDAVRINNGRDDARFVQLAWSRWPASASPGHLPRVVLRLEAPARGEYLEAARELTAVLTRATLPWHGLVLTRGYAGALEGAAVDLARWNPLVPLRFAWINVWSPASCALLGFRTYDERLFAAAQRTPDGTRVLQLTSAPLDADSNAAHVDALHAVRVRFPRIIA
jgi:hypothetical protein